MSRVDERSPCVGFPGKVIGVAHSTHSIRFFGARGHGAIAFAHPTLASARRSDVAILLPLAKGRITARAFFIPKAGRASAIESTRCAMPSPAGARKRRL